MKAIPAWDVKEFEGVERRFDAIIDVDGDAVDGNDIGVATVVSEIVRISVEFSHASISSKTNIRLYFETLLSSLIWNSYTFDCR